LRSRSAYKVKDEDEDIGLSSHTACCVFILV
jgi:hypothetical protein